MQIGRYTFSPKPWSILATALFILLFSSLGIWQLHRADEKREIITAFKQQETNLPTPLSQLANPQQYQRISIKGRYDSKHQLLLDNQHHQHQPGYQVITPFIANHTIILVNRGWIPRDKEHWPELGLSKQPRTISGSVYTPPKPFLLKAQDFRNPKWPLVIQGVEINKLSSLFHTQLRSFTLHLARRDSSGFEHDWQPTVISPARHIGYALQWFLFGIVLLILFVVLNTKRK